MTALEFKAVFLSLLPGHANNPLIPFIVLDKSGHLIVAAMDMKGLEALQAIRRKVRNEQIKSWAVALDRLAQPNQGTVRNSVLTWLVVYENAPTFGIVEYDSQGDGDPSIIDAPREDCEHWNLRMKEVLRYVEGGACPPGGWRF